MTQRQFRRLLQAETEKFPTLWKAADHFGCSESSLSRVLRGKQGPKGALLDHFNLDRHVIYLPRTHSIEDVNSLSVEREINIVESCEDLQD